VTHRVFCAMHEATDHGRGKLGPSHAAKVAESCDVDRAKLRDSRVNSCRQGTQNCRDLRGEKFLTFQPNRRKLLWRECVPTGVGEKAIDDSGNMPDMKGGGGDTCRAGIPFSFRQGLDDFADTLANLKKNVRDWLKDGGDAVDGTALPPLGIRHVSTAL
jgi:hypothetical protein